MSSTPDCHPVPSASPMAAPASLALPVPVQRLASPRARPIPKVLWGDDLQAAAQNYGRWLWYGFLAPGNLTLLTSQWKSGKTTLLSVLLARLKSGGVLAGLPLTPGKAVVVSEEDPGLWYGRSQRLDFGKHVGWICRPFDRKPTRRQWLDLIDRLGELRHGDAVDLAVVDPLASFLPGRTENDAEAMLDALLPLQQLTRLDMSVILLHHPPKGECAVGQASRGSGALPSHVDIHIEMRGHGPRSVDNRRRRLLGFSRHPETPREHIIELTADGTDYVALGSADSEGFADNWQVLQMVLEDADRKLTRQEILEQCPADFHKPEQGTLWRWLGRATPLGLVSQEGTGRRSDPFRYWLPQRLDDIPPTGVSDEQLAEWHQRQMDKWMASLVKSARPVPPKTKEGR